MCFEGYQVTGLPVTVLSRGRVAWIDGDLRAKAGDGDFIRRDPYPAVHVANSTWRETNRPQAVRRAGAGDALILRPSPPGFFDEAVLLRFSLKAWRRPQGERSSPPWVLWRIYRLATRSEAGVTSVINLVFLPSSPASIYMDVGGARSNKASRVLSIPIRSK